MTGLTWTTGLSTPAGLVANDLSRVAFLVFFNIDGEKGVVDLGGGGGELGGVAMCLLENNLIKQGIKTILSCVTKINKASKYKINYIIWC